MVDTIIVKIIGGLGNQLFQYSTGLFVSKFYNAELILDLADLDNYKRHNGFELDKIINLECKLIRSNNSYKNILTKISKRILKKYVFNKQYFDIVNEKGFNYDPSILNRTKNFYLNGYWQSAKYFDSIKNDLLNIINFNSIKFPDDLEIKIINSNSVGIHIRRGDYITNLSANSFHGICNFNYYYDAIKFIASKSDNLSLFIFSDDIENIKQNLDVDKICQSQIYYIDQKDRSSISDLYLLKLCKHKILANSSFSWWAAYLNNNSGLTVAPKKWFKVDINTDDLYLNSWIRM